ncbi:sulfurtransferase-like selenium metabolism protein YedF [Anaerococcus sp. AGMB09787]|uniref:sulfurtransferase-like selenium metabolism protein YedF n=1 Tax=Anaerococcus sp. AGMB09787 TaxID=2922869 RepID=UPI001FAFEC49|nr:sulfurtransferase-like selenium metabolism protein YedF [Anaerococcus sp. AGMB09787]
MKEVDARGIECPMPVIMAKRVVNEGEKEFRVLVSEEIAVNNLKKMASQVGFKISVSENDGEYEVIFNKEDDLMADNKTDLPSSCENPNDYVVVFDDDKIGDGDIGFSQKLIESFILALSEQEVLPKYVICYNKGVLLTSQRENTVEDLKKLEDAGVKIFSCGLCLDFYGVKKELKVGTVTNMYEIINMMRSHRVVRP